MGMTTFAISNVIFSLTTRDEQRSIFSLEVLEDRMFLYCTGGSLVAILLGTELGFFHRILNTVHLDLHQWLVCIVVGLAIIPVSEVRRLFFLPDAPEPDRLEALETAVNALSQALSGMKKGAKEAPPRFHS
jgi:magnesium-transporting ATPase (P-type)